VTRLLDNGAIITGKANCEELCMSVGSFTNVLGLVINPIGENQVAGGSSSGCAVLVANGEVDIAVGCDQGGSIRIPAHYCGIIGLKPTFGLIPYTGILPVELTLDHVGPMARTVDDIAKFMEVC